MLTISSRHLLHLALALFVAATAAVANPAAIERSFRSYVDSNACLRVCMQPVQTSERDLAIFKQSNFADYLLHLDGVCATIETARACVEACGVDSNPFALHSVTLICSAEARRDVGLLSECLRDEGARVHKECSSQCGSSYETISEQLRAATASAQPDGSDAHALTQLSGSACASLKCTSRCAVDALNARCAPLPVGRVGDLLRHLVETVLAAHRADLEANGLVETMMATSAVECNYHYAPRALFSASHDAEVLEAARRLSAAAPVVPMPPSSVGADAGQTLEALKRDAARRLSLALGQLQMRVLEKQISVLDKQARNLDQESEKASFELSRLLYKPRGALFAQAPDLF